MKKENCTANFYDVIRERRSVRSYDPSVTISDEEIKELLEEAMLAPSSSNLNPWRFMVITNQDLKEKLHPIALNQPQVLEASAMIVILSENNAHEFEHINKVNERAVAAGFMTEEVKNRLNKSIREFYAPVSDQGKREWQMLDSGLLAMQFMLAAKARGYDTVPMLGYNVEEFRKAFNVPENLTDVLMIALGKAKEPGFQTVRLTVDEVTSWNGKF
ncbi:nitroreductase family protein [Bacillus cereus]|uniref:nitroreductase family protein n=1 Tax=Bacillus cereus TaxID=1396 RepID=UPI0025A0B6A9|nr:nitroreductase family protein [Bacillus cereus]MDM5236708.1 nitroreductase family protein [Bacillus cereus]